LREGLREPVRADPSSMNLMKKNTKRFDGAAVLRGRAGAARATARLLFDVEAVLRDYLSHARAASAQARRLRADWKAGAHYQFEPYLAARGRRSSWIHAARILVVASGYGNSTFAANERCCARSYRRAA